MSLPQKYLNLPLNTKMTVAFAAGILAGLFVGKPVQALLPLGSLFIQMLEMIMLPLVICMLISSIASLPLDQLTRSGRRVLFWYMGSALAASALGVLVGAAIRPGNGLTLPAVSAGSGPAPSGFGEIFRSIVPENIFSALTEGNVLSILFFVILFALALAQSRTSQQTNLVESCIEFFRTTGNALMTVLKWIMQYAPVGVFALMAVTFSEHGLGALIPFLKVHLAIGTSYLVFCLSWALLLKRRGIPVTEFARGVRDPFLTAFVTGSSAATLPVELESAENQLRLPRELSRFSIPLGVSINKVGSAIYIGVMSVFAANAGGIPLNPPLLALIVLITFLSSVATAPVSGGAMVQLALVFKQTGLPLEAIPVVIGIPFAGKLNTSINVTGHLVTTTLVAASEKKRQR